MGSCKSTGKPFVAIKFGQNCRLIGWVVVVYEIHTVNFDLVIK
jgi:hypothetical protein